MRAGLDTGFQLGAHFGVQIGLGVLTDGQHRYQRVKLLAVFYGSPLCVLARDDYRIFDYCGAAILFPSAKPGACQLSYHYS